MPSPDQAKEAKADAETASRENVQPIPSSPEPAGPNAEAAPTSRTLVKREAAGPEDPERGETPKAGVAPVVETREVAAQEFASFMKEKKIPVREKKDSSSPETDEEEEEKRKSDDKSDSSSGDGDDEIASAVVKIQDRKTRRRKKKRAVLRN